MRDVLKLIGTVRLAADPELRSLPSGASVCQMRVAWSTSRKNGATGEWEDKPNFADLTVWGNQGEACSRYLSKGRQIVLEARLEMDEWQDKDTGAKRSKLKLVAEQVQFVSDGGNSDGGGFSAREAVPVAPPADGDPLAGTPAGPPAAAPAPPMDDDIPFVHDGFPSFEERRFHASRW